MRSIFSQFVHIFFITIILFISCSEENDQNIETNVNAVFSEPNIFGFYDDSLNYSIKEVNPNETLTDILIPYGIPYEKILKMTEVDSDLFDERKIRSGNNFIVFTEQDSLESVKYIIYESDPVNYVLFELGDTLIVNKGKKEIRRTEKEFAGVINSSLFETIAAQNESPVLALKLADVFAWQIDFYGIQAGDYFKVIYDEAFIGGKSIGIGRIKAALFNHREKDFWGFYFSQEDEIDYFDENANSLRKAFLKAPLKFTRISSRFSNSRLHPVLKKHRPHLGVDYAAPTGTPVQAIGDGIVQEAHYKGGNGNYVKIKHNSTYSSGYLHLSKYGKGIKPGVRVKQGQIIGYVGTTGLSTGPHLDLRFWKNGQLVNYLAQEFPPSKPIIEENKAAYDSVKTEMINRLNKINIETSVKTELALSK